MIKNAIVFATKAHDGQVRKATQIPFIVHPLEVFVIMSRMTSDKEVLAAAVLHDTVEDCNSVSVEDIRQEFGEKVAFYVSQESEDKSKTWPERKQFTIDHLPCACREVQMIALADKLSNIRAIKRDYDELGEVLWQRFNMKSKERIGWYYQSIAKSLKDLCELVEYKEYVSIVESVFGVIKEM